MSLRVEVEMTVKVIGRPVTEEIVLIKMLEKRDARTADLRPDSAVAVVKSLSSVMGVELSERIRALMPE